MYFQLSLFIIRWIALFTFLIIHEFFREISNTTKFFDFIIFQFFGVFNPHLYDYNKICCVPILQS